MYCSNCGAEAALGIRFCKRCGANLYNTADVTGNTAPQSRITGAVWALALATIAVGLGGLGIVFGLVAGLAGTTNVGTGLLVPMIVLGSATVFGIIAMLIRLISRLITGGGGKEQQHSAPFIRGAAIQEHSQPQIASPPRVIGSVTEQTTRNFDPSVLDQTQR